MISFNKTMTIEETTEMFKSKGDMNFLPTEHNKAMVRKIIDAHLTTLIND